MKFDDVQPELLQAWQNDPVTRSFVEWCQDCKRAELQGMLGAVRSGLDSLPAKYAGAHDALGNVIAKIEVKR